MEENQFYVNNAGLIILWPFLPQYFEQQGFVKEGAFVSQESRNRALYLLQYLVYGSIDFPAHELLLNKMFVGLPLESATTPIDAITQEETALSESLLQAVIANWSALRDTSIEALRETFLQRDGRVDMNQEDFKLTVESKTVDVLLDQLPWGISLFKLSWMEKSLLVYWR